MYEVTDKHVHSHAIGVGIQTEGQADRQADITRTRGGTCDKGVRWLKLCCSSVSASFSFASPPPAAAAGCWVEKVAWTPIILEVAVWFDLVSLLMVVVDVVVSGGAGGREGCVCPSV